MLTLLFAVAMGLSIATAATVARRIGEKNPDAAAEAATQVDSAGADDRCDLSGSRARVFAPAIAAPDGRVARRSSQTAPATRARFTAAAAPCMLLFLINGVFRGAGDAALAMRVLWIANLINIVLNPLLIFGLGPFPRLGVHRLGHRHDHRPRHRRR